MHIAATLSDASPGDQAQPPAQRLQLQRDSLPVLAVVDQARGDPVVAGRASLLQLGDRGVGGARVLGGGLEVLLAPVRLHLLQRPRPAGEDLG